MSQSIEIHSKTLKSEPISWADLVANDPVFGEEVYENKEDVPNHCDSPVYKHETTPEPNKEEKTEQNRTREEIEHDSEEYDEDPTIKEEEEEYDSEETASESMSSKNNPKSISPIVHHVAKIEYPRTSLYAYTSYDLLSHMNDFTVGQSKVQVADDSFITVNFRGKRCMIETPIATAVFGIKAYKNPGSKIIKHSLHISLGTNGSEEMEEFKNLLYKLDEWAKAKNKEIGKHANDIYWSPIRKSSNKDMKPPSLRIKIPCYNKKANIDIYTTKQKCIKSPSIDLVKRLVPHRTQVKCIIAINPIWRAGKKYGISYKLLKLKITEEAKNILFR